MSLSRTYTTFAQDEGGRGGRTDVVVLGHAFWQSRYGGDPGITGGQG